jgi:DNA-binding MarR family transcriptional regulator
MGITDRMGCFALYSAAKAVSRAYRTLLAPWDLTYPQYLVLVILWTDGPQTVNSLGASMKLDSGTLSPLLRRLENSGYITRTRSTGDERVTTVAPTEAGLALRDDLDHIPGQIRDILTTTDDSEAGALISRLHGVCDTAMDVSRDAHTDTPTGNHRKDTP